MRRSLLFLGLTAAITLVSFATPGAAVIQAGAGGRGGLVFDYYSEKDYKFVALDLVSGASSATPSSARRPRPTTRAR
jgi:hypothetical protein